jgi:N-acetylneuraminic acid mutarotase
MTGSNRIARLLFVTLLTALPGFAQSGTWSTTGSLANARSGQGAAVLQTGNVLVVGGFSLSGVLGTAEVYNAAFGTWSATGSVNTARYAAPAVTLANGKVLFAGGCTNNCTGVTTSAELYNPTTGTWSFTGSLHVPRYFYTATLLSSGKVLVVGGCNASSCNTVTPTAELYDPTSGTWTTTGSLSIARDFQTATALSDGRVLVVGGYSTAGKVARAEVYNPATGKWTSAGNLNNPRAQGTATLLPNGKVLVVGGLDQNGGRLASAELYNPSTNSWTLTGSLINKRYDATATLLATGKVLLAGGSGLHNRAAIKLAACELYDPATGTWSSTGNLNVGRTQHTASMLQNGKILAVGGLGSSYLSSAELYTP